MRTTSRGNCNISFQWRVLGAGQHGLSLRPVFYAAGLVLRGLPQNERKHPETLTQAIL